jgi:membrane-associated phospholipid phosphatase
MERGGFFVTSGLLLAAFLALAAFVSPRLNETESSLSHWDSQAYLSISGAHYRPFDLLMILFTEYGREIVWSATGIVLLVFGGSSGRKTVLLMAMAMLVLVPLGTIAKEVVGRPRPTIPESDFLIAPDTHFAYPSGHAMIVSAGAAVILSEYRGSTRKLAIGLGLAIEAGLVCFSRVYVGGHYPLDAVGGIMLGLGIAFIFLGFAKRIETWVIQLITKALKR